MFSFDKYPTLYDQQKHNNRLTVVLMIFFLLVAVILGLGFDSLLPSRYTFRFYSIPLLAVILGGSLHHLKNKLRFGFASASDDDDSDYFKLSISLVLKTFVFLIFFLYLWWDMLYEYNYHQPYFKHYTIDGFFPFGTILASVIGIVCVLTSTRWGAHATLWSLQAVPVSDTDLETTELHNVVDEMRLAAGIPKPDIYVLDDKDPNAFSIGKNSQDSYIVVTSGLLKMLNREELQGVIAHEMSHIRNHDIRLRTTYLALFGSIVLLSDWSKKSLAFGGFQPGAFLKLKGIFKIIGFVAWLLTILLAPIIAWILAMAISRNREYLADISAAELTRNPLGLIQALQKIENASGPTVSCGRSVAAFCIVDPSGRRVNKKEGFWANLFATHPPIEKRIFVLETIAHKNGYTLKPTEKVQIENGFGEADAIN